MTTRGPSAAAPPSVAHFGSERPPELETLRVGRAAPVRSPPSRPSVARRIAMRFGAIPSTSTTLALTASLSDAAPAPKAPFAPPRPRRTGAAPHARPPHTRDPTKTRTQSHGARRRTGPRSSPRGGWVSGAAGEREDLRGRLLRRGHEHPVRVAHRQRGDHGRVHDELRRAAVGRTRSVWCG